VTIAALALLPLTVLALVVLAIYAPVSPRAGLDPVTVGLQGTACAMTMGNVGWLVLRMRWRSPREQVYLAGRAGLLATLTALLLIDIGQSLGWMHGAYEASTLGICCLAVVAMPLYWFGGKRRLLAVLTARAASGRD
jgi:hypothetical protein